MKKPQNNSQHTFTLIGILLTSSILLAAFTYSEKELIKNDLNKTEPIKMVYSIEKTIKPKEKKPILAPKKETKQITTSLKKDVTSTTKLIKNKTKYLYLINLPKIILTQVSLIKLSLQLHKQVIQ